VLSPDPSEEGHIRACFRAERGALELQFDLDLPARGLTAFFGPSGSGKTTCLRVLAGLERAHGVVRVGEVTWQDDERGVFLAPHRRGVGFVFQDASLFAHLTVRGNLEYARRRSRSNTTGAEARSVIDLFDLGPLLDRRPTHLSGGEVQRVAIARALLASPQVLLMDEPLASLDVARKAEILPYLERLRDRAAIPILYVSHSLEEVSRLANYLVLFERGATVASGPVAETLARLDLPTARFDDASVVIEARVAHHDEVDHLTGLDFPGGRLWVAQVDRPIDAAVRVRVLARDVSLTRDRPGPSSILNVLDARLEELQDDGPGRVNVRLSLGTAATPMLARITRRSRDALSLHVGMSLYASVKSVALVA
jgi:molybdate transport system ATP-binding protein